MKSIKKVAVITGAASGIGLALATQCFKRGMAVVMADNDAATLSRSAKQLGSQNHADLILPVVCDVTQEDNLVNLAATCISQFKRIDWLFNNAGICGEIAPFWEISSHSIRNVMDINLYGMIYGIKAFLPFMFQQEERSHIINMASFYGLCGSSQLAAYTMSKHAIVALSESLYFDLKNNNKPVDVSVVCPSFVNTQLLANHTSSETNKLHDLLENLIGRSRSTDSLAEHIIREVLNDTFYILPDKEVKDYCEGRMQAIKEEKKPHPHALEKLINILYQRALSTKD